MTSILHAWAAVMLVCVPISLIFVFIVFVFRYAQGEKIESGSGWETWLNTYVIVAVCQTAAFAAVTGIMMLLGAFR